jgi:hypothetical protein
MLTVHLGEEVQTTSHYSVENVFSLACENFFG